MMNVDGITLPYAWNHTITYDETFGPQPYLVQQLQTREINILLQPDDGSLTFTLDSIIAPGEFQSF